MIQEGAYAKCDRCGQRQFAPNDEGGRVAIFGAMGWRIVSTGRGKRQSSAVLCPECYNKYSSIFDEFMEKADKNAP